MIVYIALAVAAAAAARPRETVEYASFVYNGLFFSFQNGHSAVSMSIAEQYVAAFSNLAKESNTLLLPSNTGDVSNMVSQVS
jgi:C-terminal region of band_7